MIRRTKTKRQLKAEERFNAVVTEFILSLGARPGSFYDHELDTPAGLLHISCHETWVACRFDDVTQGAKFTESCGRSCNLYSGKWNFHYADIAQEAVLSDLGYWFGRLMTWKPVAKEVES